MHIERIYLENFRNYEKASISFQQGKNLITGENGSGKSNLLEALYFLNTGKSFRTHKLTDLVRHEQSHFTIHVEFYKENNFHHLKLRFGNEGRILSYNQKQHASFLSLIGLIPFILLSPEDLSIINGPPQERRRFLDLYLAQSDPLYLYHLTRYQRALKQRNSLLKNREEKGLAPWEELMAIAAEYLLIQRKKALQLLQEPCEEAIKKISQEKEILSLKYISSLSSNESYQEQWEKIRKKEIALGTTLIGPHRDNITFLLDGKDLTTFGSEGQKRCSIAALRLAQWERMKEKLGDNPIFGIDDFCAHLDPKRALRLEEIVANMGQTFLTTPTLDSARTTLSLRVNQGSVSYSSCS